MPRSTLRLVHDAARPPKSAPEVKPPVLGRWFTVTANFTVRSLDRLRPDDLPPAAVFMSSGSMSVAEAAQALQTLARMMGQDGAMH